MPNARILEEKKKIVADMTERLKSKSGVFVDYRGISGVEATQMRAKLREANVEYSVIKNSLMRFAIKNAGFDELESVLVGTTSLATSNDDPVAPARIIKEYAVNLPDYFEIKAGFMDGKILSKSEVIAIASIPALPVLQAQFLGTLLAPISKLAVVLKAIAEKEGATADVEVVASAKTEQKEEAPTAEETKAEAEAPAETKADAAEEKSEKAVDEKPAVEESADAKTEEAPAKE